MSKRLRYVKVIKENKVRHYKDVFAFSESEKVDVTKATIDTRFLSTVEVWPPQLELHLTNEPFDILDGGGPSIVEPKKRDEAGNKSASEGWFALVHGTSNKFSVYDSDFNLLGTKGTGSSGSGDALAISVDPFGRIGASLNNGVVSVTKFDVSDNSFESVFVQRSPGVGENFQSPSLGFAPTSIYSGTLKGQLFKNNVAKRIRFSDGSIIASFNGTRDEFGNPIEPFHPNETCLIVSPMTAPGGVVFALIDDSDSFVRLVKFDENLSLQWYTDPNDDNATGFSRPGGTPDENDYSIGCDGDGNCIVTKFNSSIKKYDPDGNIIWSIPGAMSDKRDISVENTGEFYVIGRSPDTVKKYSAGSATSDPTEQWSYSWETATVPNSVSTNGNGSVVAVDGSGNVVILDTADGSKKKGPSNLGGGATSIAFHPGNQAIV